MFEFKGPKIETRQRISVERKHHAAVTQYLPTQYPLIPSSYSLHPLHLSSSFFSPSRTHARISTPPLTLTSSMPSTPHQRYEVIRLEKREGPNNTPSSISSPLCLSLARAAPCLDQRVTLLQTLARLLPLSSPICMSISSLFLSFGLRVKKCLLHLATLTTTPQGELGWSQID